MSKLFPIICAICLLSLAYVAVAASTDTVSIDVAGYINHGPMQPTIRAIKEVVSKYEDKVNVNWIDLATEEGQDYFKDHDLSAHLNVIINGNYRYKLDGKEVTFQWFEGQNWTKKDLDAVISDTLDNNGKAVPVDD
jgi:hypothetical protein